MVIGPIAWPRPSRPRPGQDLFGEPVELADVPEGERAQEGPQGGGRHDPMAEHLAGSATAQQVGVVDAVPTRPASVAGSNRPASAMAWVSSKQMSSWSRMWEDRIEKVPSWSGIRQLSQAPFSQVRGPFS